MRSAVNLSRIVRAAGCSGVSRIIACGEARLDPQIARDGAELVKIEKHRTLPPVLRALRSEGWHLIGLEQTGSSRSLYTYSFPRRCVLVIGNEREGLDRECLGLCHDLVEIPVYGLPYAHNAATAAAIALYEYCRQYPRG
jgi:tRNA G18 (ribose-2'-O)-methylase SpoU